jgi:hypothetical protein
MNTYFAVDKFSLSNVTVTDEGYVIARNSNIARTGVQSYYAYELGLDKDSGIDPMKVIRLNRSPEEVFAPDSLKTLDRTPLTVDHPPKGVAADTWSKLVKGDVHGPRENGEFVTAAEIYIRSKDAVEAYRSGKKELSIGYAFQLDMTPGTNHKGEAFDGSMKNIRGNHVAMVDSARCGSACRIADSNSTPTGDSIMTMQKVTVDGIPLEVSDTAAAAINKLVIERDKAVGDLKVAGDSLAGSLTKAAHDALVAAKDTEIAALKKDVMTPEARDAMVSDWAKMTADAKALAPDVTTTGKTCAAVRKEVVAAVVAKDAKVKPTVDAMLMGKTLDAADAETVRMVFNVLATTHVPAANRNTGDAARVAEALTGKAKQEHAAQDGAAKLVGRAAFLARSQAGFAKQ